MNPTNLSVAILVLLFAIVLVSMARSWRSKSARSDAAVPAPPSVPADPGPARTEAMEGTYVSSTTADDYLARVLGHGLGVRSAATVQVHDAGVVVRRDGPSDLFLPAADLVGVFRSGGMAGKYVGGKGLVVVRWHLRGGEEALVLDTGLHLRHQADRSALVDAVQALVDAPAQPTTPPSAPPAPPAPPASEEPR